MNREEIKELYETGRQELLEFLGIDAQPQLEYKIVKQVLENNPVETLGREEVTDLTGCYCDATQEHYDKLVEMGYELSSKYVCVCKYLKVNLSLGVVEGYVKYKKHETKITLINNKWYKEIEDGRLATSCDDMGLVIPVDPNNSLGVCNMVDKQRLNPHCPTQWGFEAEKMINLIFKDHRGFIIGYIVENVGEVSRMWNVDGECFTLEGDADYHYDLTPIKPKWYEDESNFPEIIIDKFGRIELAISFNKKTQRLHFRKDLYSNICNGWQRVNDLTKEELLTLLVEDV